MQGKNKLQPVQILGITVSAMMGIHIITIQRDLVMTANRDAWISMLISGVLAFGLGLFVNFPLAALYPEKDLAEITLMVFGKVLGRILLIPFTAYLLLEIGLSIRLFVQVIKVFLLDRTPEAVLVVLVVLTVASLFKRQVSAIGAAIDFMFPVFLLPLILLALLAFMQFDMMKVKPIMYNNIPGILKTVPIGFSSIFGYTSIHYYLKHVVGPKNAKKWYGMGIALSVVLYSLFTFLSIGVFGPENIKILTYPTLSLSKAIEFPITLLERLESLLAILWIPGVISWLVLGCFPSIRNFITFFSLKKKHEKYIIFLHIPILCLIALAAPDETAALDILNQLFILDIIIGVVYFPLLAIIAWIKKRREKCP